ncbi:MAG: hypothetical protein K6T94_10055 [Paenibacillus sp.]|nr:hypothetical protein [Paenibacillus sp.]
MKTNQVYMLLASVILGISFIIGCSLLSNAKVLKAEPMVAQQQETVVVEQIKPLMKIAEAAGFLNMTEAQVLEIIKAEHSKLSTTGSFAGAMFPYIKVDNEFYISKDELMNWIKEASINKRNYFGGKVHSADEL